MKKQVIVKLTTYIAAEAEGKPKQVDKAITEICCRSELVSYETDEKKFNAKLTTSGNLFEFSEEFCDDEILDEQTMKSKLMELSVEEEDKKTTFGSG
jgi:hypothetical protein